MKHLANEEARKNVLNRLRTIKGHIAGIEKMVEEGKCCDEILLQVAAIKSSVHKVGLMIMEENMMDCLAMDKEGNPIDRAQLEALMKTLIQYVK